MSRIFVFDNNADTLRSVAYALQTDGHEVFTNMYTLKATGVQKINTDPVVVLKYMLGLDPLPDIVIVECLEVDGEEFIAMLKAISVSANMVILTTSHMGKSQEPHGKARRLAQLYGVHFVPKPFSLKFLVPFVTNFLAVRC